MICQDHKASWLSEARFPDSKSRALPPLTHNSTTQADLASTGKPSQTWLRVTASVKPSPPPPQQQYVSPSHSSPSTPPRAESHHSIWLLLVYLSIFHHQTMHFLEVKSDLDHLCIPIPNTIQYLANKRHSITFSWIYK